jgi:glycosyltransferase 2 family protein
VPTRMAEPAPIAEPRWVTRVVVSLCALAVSWVVAVQRPLPEPELRLTRWVNGAPDVAATVLWPVMQLGSLLGPFLAGVVLLVARRPRRAAIAVVSGVGAWYAAKLVKSIVERGRPLAYLPDVDVREGAGTGLGYVSGHTAVAFALAFALSPVLPRWARYVAVGVAALVGVARIVYGVHLPADVVGGAALGVLVATAVEAAARAPAALRRRHEVSQRATSTM